jgi:hypothetical protein
MSFNFLFIGIFLLMIYTASPVAGQQPENYINKYTGIQLDYPSSLTYHESTQFPNVSFFPIPESGAFASTTEQEV